MLTSKCNSSAVTQQNHITPLVAYGIRIYFKVLLISFKTKLDVGSGPKLLLKTNLRIPYESGKSTRFTCMLCGPKNKFKTKGVQALHTTLLGFETKILRPDCSKGIYQHH